MPANNTSRPTYRPWLWLGLAFGLSFVAAGRWTIPLATWIAPTFMLRFIRQQPAWRGYGLGVLATAGAGFAAWNGLIPLSGAAFYGFVVVSTCIGFLPYLADRLLTPHLDGVLTTLIFPTAMTTLEYLMSFGDYGTWGATAYTQQNLTLLQLTSVTGIWGVTFLIHWTASIINAAWDVHFRWRRFRAGALLYGVTMAAVLVFGSARLVFAPVPDTVPVATVTGTSHAGNFFSTVDLDRPKALRDITHAIQHDYLTRARRAAQSGARLVTWPEAAVPVLASEEDQLIDRCTRLAREARIYLAMALAVLPADFPASNLENKIVWIGPDGHVLGEYLKARPVPGEPSVAGDGRLPLIDTPFGTWTAAICFDMDHHRLIRQAGQRGADIILAPSNDWSAIASMHAHMARVRAIENGASLLRPTSQGRTLVTDPQGRTLAQMDHFSTDEHVLMAHVPTKGTATIYATIGDVFAWGCGLGFIGLLGAVLRRRASAPDARSAASNQPDVQR